MLPRLILIFLSGVALFGCGSTPKATYTTANGCGIAQWTEASVTAQVTSMTWSGPCVSGLAHGEGTLLVSLTNNRQRLYTGTMAKGAIHGEGIYTPESGWKYQGNFIWLTFTGGKVYNASGQLLFDGLMAHNEKFEGRNLNYSDQRYHTGSIYWHDKFGSSVEDGRFTGSSGPGLGFTSIDVTTGAGLIYGKVIQNGKVVVRWVEGRRYADDIAYDQARTRYYESILAAMEKENKVLSAELRIKDEEDKRQTIAALSGALGAAAGGKNANERLKLATDALNKAPPGSGSSTGGVPFTGAGNSGIEISGSMRHCLKIVPAKDDLSVNTANIRNGPLKTYVIVNKCNEDIDYHFCTINGGKNYENEKILEKNRSCEAVYGGDGLAKSGKIAKPNARTDDTFSNRFIWFDRKHIQRPESWFACNARTEQIRTITPYGKVLDVSNRQCVPRQGFPPVPIYHGKNVIPADE